MNETTSAIPSASSREVAVPTVGFVDLLIILARRKKLIVGLPVSAAVIAVAVSFAMPNIYRSSTKILPPQQAQSGAAALLAQLGGVAAAAGAGAAGIKNPNDLYIGMLKSRRIADSLIQRFKLKDVYESKWLDAARKELDANTAIVSGKDGLITIDVEDTDPQRAAALANAYADELLQLTKVIAVTEASQRRLFFEHQLENSKNNLEKSEQLLKNSLGSRGVISVDSESRGIVETVARLRAQITAKEVQIGAMQAFVTGNHQDYKRAQEELASLRAEQARLENGRPGAVPQSDNVGLENMKALRELKYHQMLYELLSKQYEVARLDETKDSSIIQVLDRAEVPERKFKPRRAVLAFLAGLTGLLVAVLWSFIADANARAMIDPDRAARLTTLKNYLRFR